jgi:hypothetical protein
VGGSHGCQLGLVAFFLKCCKGSRLGLMACFLSFSPFLSQLQVRAPGLFHRL